MSEETSLYEQVGGEAGIEKLVGLFYKRVLSDPELGPFFEQTDTDKLKRMQKEFFSEALGGPPFYSGRSMREVHAGRGIKKSHLRRFTAHLMATLEDSNHELELDERQINAIYSRIALEADEITGGGSTAG